MINIEELKVQAKELKDVTGAKLSHCQNEIAKTKGFKDWQTMIIQTVGKGYVARQKQVRKKENIANFGIWHGDRVIVEPRI